MKLLPIIFLLFIVLRSTIGCGMIVCYYTNWAQHRNGDAKFFPEHVDPSLCTHLIYAFAVLKDNKLVNFEENDKDTPWAQGMYARFAQLKEKNPNLKTLLAVGGWNFGSKPFSQMVETADNRQEFINHGIGFLRAHRFDGLDLDWEYPALRGGMPDDKERFTLLVMELKEAITAEAIISGKPRLLLTAALGAGKPTIDAAYEVARIAQIVDWINVMTYNFHGGFDTTANHNAPLYSMTKNASDTFTVDFAINYYLQLGVPESKLVLGLPTYGRNSRLVNKYKNTPGSPINGEGRAGPFTLVQGTLAYFEYCKLVKDPMTLIGRAGMVPYAVYNSDFLGYDDVESIKEKVKYAKLKNLGGIMFWTVDFDDFNGKFCGEGVYPLMNAAKKQCELPDKHQGPGTDVPLKAATGMHNDGIPPPQKVPAKTIETKAGSSNDNDHNSLCSNVEGVRDFPDDCSKYVMCVNTFSYVLPCPGGLVFNKVGKYCDWPFNVQGC
ncbi:chitinase-3-like protein 1 [Biomphalaria pfeifferi]|uniref:Chitinase-3-like protein 1 n=1 Tax=Biomphalaria pfeifferi TaxID=112525 RepID=A0AAD8FIU4_BIOPF|nr:chitinase-3-like protein 1 [Biomphalaria pfeifferi]